MTPIILVDDQPIANFITKKLLQNAGYIENIKDFTDAFIALEEVKQVQNSIILLDLNMPGMSGWEFMDAMQNLGLENRVIILSSSTSEIDIARAKEYPYVMDYVVKPLNKTKFIKMAPLLEMD
ncbi:response regulator [Zunongwangia endophytica]|uniref:Response regulator n=1 Tax=Zunongwangia endophytica TaxID=1808945 RepID=A0ABV8H6N1_9FLAO|nr:response regulator [Zunongwangia endophytica]MDN3594770.1 response regulator [Zunongwangia endophytica]